MEYTLRNSFWKFSLNENGMVVSIVNGYNGHEYCQTPGETFRLVYQEGEHFERSIHGCEQKPEITVSGNQMKAVYHCLSNKCGQLDATLCLTYTLDGPQLQVTADIENRSDVLIAEIQITAVSGIKSLGGAPENDYLMWPRKLGYQIKDPLHADMFAENVFFKKKYERPDHRHSDLDLPYPGFGSMQWYSLCNASEGIYIANHDPKTRIICLHVERTVATESLRLGVAQYPFLSRGESYEGPTVVYAMLDGDWHKGARIYRQWMEDCCNWIAPDMPLWTKEFQGWLRCIFRPQNGEHNFTFKDIPWMFDEAQAAGIDTIFVLGWTRGGFARRWPDYIIDEEQGGAEELKKSIDYVHSKGGKLIMFLSYSLIDRKSEYYCNEGGETATIKDIWGEEVPFSETYAADGTYRKFHSPPMPMFVACPGSDHWHEKMKKSADYCLELGCDGVLYDLGGQRPLFCFAENHDHKRPNESYCSKGERYVELRENVKRHGKENAMMQEDIVDVYAKSMDIIQPATQKSRGNDAHEMLRYTFPELRITNRSMALDENKMLDNINHTFLYGLAYDLSIFRCWGTVRDIPNYAAYLKKVLALRKTYGEYFFHGTFVDEDGFTVSSRQFFQKAYKTADGRLGVAVWNGSSEDGAVIYTNTETGTEKTVCLKKNEICFVEL